MGRNYKVKNNVFWFLFCFRSPYKSWRRGTPTPDISTVFCLLCVLRADRKTFHPSVMPQRLAGQAGHGCVLHHGLKQQYLRLVVLLAWGCVYLYIHSCFLFVFVFFLPALSHHCLHNPVMTALLQEVPVLSALLTRGSCHSQLRGL